MPSKRLRRCITKRYKVGTGWQLSLQGKKRIRKNQEVEVEINRKKEKENGGKFINIVVALHLHHSHQVHIPLQKVLVLPVQSHLQWTQMNHMRRGKVSTRKNTDKPWSNECWNVLIDHLILPNRMASILYRFINFLETICI